MTAKKTPAPLTHKQIQGLLDDAAREMTVNPHTTRIDVVELLQALVPEALALDVDQYLQGITYPGDSDRYGVLHHRAATQRFGRNR